jgi:hypothetical protein
LVSVGRLALVFLRTKGGEATEAMIRLVVHLYSLPQHIRTMDIGIKHWKKEIKNIERDMARIES